MRLLPKRRPRRPVLACRRRPRLEELELRNLLSAGPGTDFHETIDHALDLSVLDSGGPLAESGTIGNGPDGAADINYYQFTLLQPAHVQLGAQAPLPGGSAYVLSLYDTDPLDLIGNRLVAQDDGAAHGGVAAIDTELAAGVYY